MNPTFSTWAARTLGSTLGAIALIVTLTVPPSQAQQGGRGGMAACRTDVATFCAGIEAGGGKRMQCLMANEAKLQPACADLVKARMADRGARKTGGGNAPPTTEAPAAQAQGQAQPPASAPGADTRAQPPAAAGPAQPAAGLRPMQVCKSDVAALCGTVAPGGGSRMRCLRENLATISTPCADALAARQGDRKSVRAASRGACKADVQTLCASQKGPERRACLTANVDKLSPSCAATLKPN